MMHVEAILMAATSFYTCRCEDNGGLQSITTSNYHESINVTVPLWQLNTTWGDNGILSRFDNVIMALWTLFQVCGGWSGSTLLIVLGGRPLGIP